MEIEELKFFWTTKIIKIGNSSGIRIPKSLLDILGLSAGTLLEIKVDNGKIIIELPKDK